MNELAQTIYASIEESSKSESLSVIEKLNNVFANAAKNTIINSNVMTAIHNVENRELREKLNIHYIKEIEPLITDIFNEGYAKKIMGEKHPCKICK